MFASTPRTLLRSASSDLTEPADVSQNIADHKLSLPSYTELAWSEASDSADKVGFTCCQEMIENDFLLALPKSVPACYCVYKS